jgi:tetratricopeptide (TPR) repeat protein
MSSQSIWFAYDAQWASSIRTRLNESDISDLWLIENVTPSPTPRITYNKYLGNPILKITSKKPSENELSYDPMRGDHQTIESLNNFLRRQCWCSAVDWTTNHLLKNPHNYHIWFIRFACLIKLRLFQEVENEFETFGNLNSYSKFPFSLRLLHAELPIYMDSNRFHEGLDRLFRLLMITNTILSILPKDQIQLWQKRRLRILYSIANCYTLMKRIDLIISIIENQIIKNENIEQQIELYLLIVRILLQTGDELNAQRAFDRALGLLSSKENLPNEFLITKELFSLFRNDFSSNKLISPLKNPIETNNHCVILLYMSKMKESLDLYEKLIREKNENIHEAIIYNICTIYELESFRFTQKKHDLIDYISQYIGDGFSLTALKLPI